MIHDNAPDTSRVRKAQAAGASDEPIAHDIKELLTRLYPLCRSITGDGVRETLRIISELVPLSLHEVPSGTAVLDWTVPPEWNIRDAWVKDPDGRKVIDFGEHNLHVVSYSIPVAQRMTLEELRPHLHSLPQQPDLVPYRTAYYANDWGFCLSQQLLDALPEGEYEVCIDSSLKPGSLSYGELLIPGQSSAEILVSSHVCHPSLANDNLSGNVIAAYLAKQLLEISAARRLRYSYRFLFAPATIGALSWLAANANTVGNIHGGLTLACLGDERPFTYKQSRRGNTEIDQAVCYRLRSEDGHTIENFSPQGYDERQFCSPGFNLAVGRLGRAQHGRHDEYHTSADNLDFVSADSLAQSLALCADVLHILEENRRLLNLQPYGEPQLGKYGLYESLGGTSSPPQLQTAVLWVLNLSDGHHALLDIAEQSNLPFATIVTAAAALEKANLLGECD